MIVLARVLRLALRDVLVVHYREFDQPHELSHKVWIKWRRAEVRLGNDAVRERLRRGK